MSRERPVACLGPATSPPSSQHVHEWWGPRGFTNTTEEMDVRPGGVWRFVMHGPDGVDYNNKIVYLEIVKPERLVMTMDTRCTGDGVGSIVKS